MLQENLLVEAGVPAGLSRSMKARMAIKTAMLPSFTRSLDHRQKHDATHFAGRACPGLDPGDAGPHGKEKPPKCHYLSACGFPYHWPV
jgi:hypothetical protein